MKADVPIPWSSIGTTVVVFGLWAVGLVIYAIRTTIKGRFQNHRVTQMGGTRLLNTWTMEYGYWMIHGVGNTFIKYRVNPNLITAVSLVMALASGVALYFGWFGEGGWLMIGAALLDVLDGWVARETDRASEAGEYFDSVVDRYSELITFVALMGYYFPFQPVVGLVAAAAMVASIMITFNRAKGEAQGITDVPSGLMRRHERLMYLGVGTAASPILAMWLEPGVTRPVYHLAVAALGLVALVGNITAIRLGLRIHRRLQQQGAEQNERPGEPTAS